MLFIQNHKSSVLIVQIYVDSIMFRGTSMNLVDEFIKCMKNEFEISMMRELGYFLALSWKIPISFDEAKK